MGRQDVRLLCVATSCGIFSKVFLYIIMGQLIKITLLVEETISKCVVTGGKCSCHCKSRCGLW